MVAADGELPVVGEAVAEVEAGAEFEGAAEVEGLRGVDADGEARGELPAVVQVPVIAGSGEVVLALVFELVGTDDRAQALPGGTAAVLDAEDEQLFGVDRAEGFPS